MPDDTFPPDVRAVLRQLLGEASDALDEGDRDTALATLDTVATVTENKVPAGPRRERLEHCCRTVEDRLEEGDEENVAVAREYLASMADRLDTGRGE